MFGLNLGSKDPWPLKFGTHSFGARAYNVQRCTVIYDRHEHGIREQPVGPPESSDWRSNWNAGYGVGTGFPPAAQVSWISADGTPLDAEVDIAKLIKDRLVRHNVPKDDIPEGWLAAKAVNPVPIDVLMEINDRTITVYTRALVATKEPQIPGNPRSMGRRDLIEVWTHTY
ncbi:hypothetical protein [Pseudoxanthomonas sp.]|uniref:hypothetical protein n=1 Tax=Pseudoxanthomonas sp. TaxID=1871049 RepID=UPI002639A7ED|nr:hypothetical protein [Pseudoxanthomonas sp.]WDS37782.1 MAG: hypothetical protein O8I58_07910 [Pseudoxanthomonas sp.]